MAAKPNIVDQLNTNDEEISQPTLKIQHNNLWFNPLINDHPDELKMLVQVMNDSVLTYTLTALFAIPMKWLSLVDSTVVYNRTTELVTFHVTSNKTKRLMNKQFAQILKLPFAGEFDEVTSD